MSKNIKLLFLMAGASMLFSGCANSIQPQPQKTQKEKIVYINRDKPYKFTYVPIIGTQTPDDKVVVNMGVVLRVWIHSYKTRNDDLVSSHDIYIWGKKPDFIVGNALPTLNRGMLTPQGKMPFILTDNSVDRSDFKDNLNIRNYVNSVYKAKHQGKSFTQKRVKESKKYDEEIKAFIKNIQKQKKDKK